MLEYYYDARTHNKHKKEIKTGYNFSSTAVLKVKVTLVQALRLCTGRTAHRGSRGIALLFHDHGTRMGWGVSVTPRPLFTPGKDPVPIVQEVWRAPGPVWTGVENFAPAGIRSQDRPARSQSLYRLSYPAHTAVIAPNVSWHTSSCRVASTWTECSDRECWRQHALPEGRNRLVTLPCVWTANTVVGPWQESA